MKKSLGILIGSIVMGSLFGCVISQATPPATTEAVMPAACVEHAITLGQIADDPTLLMKRCAADARLSCRTPDKLGD